MCFMLQLLSWPLHSFYWAPKPPGCEQAGRQHQVVDVHLYVVVDV